MSGELHIIRLNDIPGFHHITARMPTAEETERHQVPAGVPVLVMHLPYALIDGKVKLREQIYRADVVGFTIDTRPAPDPDGEREAAREILHHVMEDLTNTVDDLDHLARGLRGTPGEVRRVAERLRDQRAAEWQGDSWIVGHDSADNDT